MGTLSLILICLALLMVLAVAIDLSLPAIREWQRRRSVVRDSAAAQRLRAMQAAHELSLMAWRARQELHRLAREASQSEQTRVPIRRK